MRAQEAAYIGRLLNRLPQSALARVVELGSSTASFRRTHQPHIFQHIDTVIASRGGVHLRVDLKDEPGIDIVGDVCEARVRTLLEESKPTLTLCCNILEHVEDRAAFCRVLGEFVPPNAWLLASVPESYPYHLDPIDTLYRPGMAELFELLRTAGFAPVEGRMVESTTYWSDLTSAHGTGGALGVLAKVVAKSVLIRGGPEQTKARLHRLLWLARPYRVAVCLTRKV